MTDPGNTWPLIFSCAVVAGWILLALLAPSLGRRHRTAAFWITTATGIPVLGWLTWTWGPGVGVAVFALGMVLLRRSRKADPVTAPAE